MVHLNKNIFHNISVVDVQHSVKSLFSDSTRKWAVKWVWINEGGLPSYFQQRWPLAPASLTAVWTPKTFQTNFPFPDTLLPSKDAQSGKDSQYPCPGNIERHWCDKLFVTRCHHYPEYLNLSGVSETWTIQVQILFPFVEMRQFGKDFWSQFHYNLIPTQLVLIRKRLWRLNIIHHWVMQTWAPLQLTVSNVWFKGNLSPE